MGLAAAATHPNDRKECKLFLKNDELDYHFGK